MPDRSRPAAYTATTVDGHVLRHVDGVRFPSARGLITLAFWECGHIEVDQERTHPCDGRDVCSAGRCVPESRGAVGRARLLLRLWAEVA
jgi:hypothetical protein